MDEVFHKGSGSYDEYFFEDDDAKFAYACFVTEDGKVWGDIQIIDVKPENVTPGGGEEPSVPTMELTLSDLTSESVKLNITVSDENAFYLAGTDWLEMVEWGYDSIEEYVEDLVLQKYYYVLDGAAMEDVFYKGSNVYEEMAFENEMFAYACFVTDDGKVLGDIKTIEIKSENIQPGGGEAESGWDGAKEYYNDKSGTEGAMVGGGSNAYYTVKMDTDADGNPAVGKAWITVTIDNSIYCVNSAGDYTYDEGANTLTVEGITYGFYTGPKTTTFTFDVSADKQQLTHRQRNTDSGYFFALANPAFGTSIMTYADWKLYAK